MTSQIDMILVAYIDYNPRILSTDIINNEVAIILSLEMDEYNSLIGDAIENELQEEYDDDVEVIVKETNDGNDIESTKPNEYSFIMLVVIICVLILCFAVCSICFIRLKRRKRAEIAIIVSKSSRDNQIVSGMNDVQHNVMSCPGPPPFSDVIEETYDNHNARTIEREADINMNELRTPNGGLPSLAPDEFVVVGDDEDRDEEAHQSTGNVTQGSGNDIGEESVSKADLYVCEQTTEGSQGTNVHKTK
eukprot:810168_1